MDEEATDEMENDEESNSSLIINEDELIEHNKMPSDCLNNKENNFFFRKNSIDGSLSPDPETLKSDVLGLTGSETLPESIDKIDNREVYSAEDLYSKNEASLERESFLNESVESECSVSDDKTSLDENNLNVTRETIEDKSQEEDCLENKVDSTNNTLQMVKDTQDISCADSQVEEYTSGNLIESSPKEAVTVANEEPIRPSLDESMDMEEGELEEGELEDDDDEDAVATGKEDELKKDDVDDTSEQNKENRESYRRDSKKSGKNEREDKGERKDRKEKKRKHEEEKDKNKRKKRSHDYNSEDESMRRKGQSVREKQPCDFDTLLRRQIHLVESGSNQDHHSMQDVDNSPFSPQVDSFDSASGDEWEAKAIRRRVQQRKRRGSRSPNRKSDAICMFYHHGSCKRGLDCPYSHDIAQSRKMELCKFYMMDCCAKKEKCLYMHKDFPCKYYHFGIKCKDGKMCRFSHDSLQEITRNILLKHIELAPKDILGDFPRLSKHSAQIVLSLTEAKRSGEPIDEEALEKVSDYEGKGFRYLDRALKNWRKNKETDKDKPEEQKDQKTEEKDKENKEKIKEEIKEKTKDSKEKNKDSKEKEEKGGKEKSKVRDRERSKDRERDREKSKDRDREKYKDQEREKDKDRSPLKFRNRDRDEHREREKSKRDRRERDRGYSERSKGRDDSSDRRGGTGRGGRGPRDRNRERHRSDNGRTSSRYDSSNDISSRFDSSNDVSSRFDSLNDFPSKQKELFQRIEDRRQLQDGPQMDRMRESSAFHPDGGESNTKWYSSDEDADSGRFSENRRDTFGSPRERSHRLGRGREEQGRNNNQLNFAEEPNLANIDFSYLKNVLNTVQTQASQNKNSQISPLDNRSNTWDQRQRMENTTNSYMDIANDLKEVFSEPTEHMKNFNRNLDSLIQNARELGSNQGSSSSSRSFIDSRMGDRDNFSQGVRNDLRNLEDDLNRDRHYNRNLSNNPIFRDRGSDSSSTGYPTTSSKGYQDDVESDSDIFGNNTPPRIRGEEPKHHRRSSDSNERTTIYDIGFGSQEDPDMEVPEDMNAFPILKVPMHSSAKEIDASINSHPPLYYQLIPITIPKPDFSKLKIDKDDPKNLEDPRLRIMLRRNSSEKFAFSPPGTSSNYESEQIPGSPSLDPRSKLMSKMVDLENRDPRKSITRELSRSDSRRGSELWPDLRNDPRADPRNDPRSDPRNDPRFDSRNDLRPDLRNAPRSDLRNDPRSDLRNDPRSDSRNDPRSDPRNDPRSDPRNDPRSDPRNDPRSDPRNDPRSDPRNDPRADPRSDPRANLLMDPRSEQHMDVHPRFDPRFDSMDPRSDRRIDPRMDSRNDPRMLSKNENLGTNVRDMMPEGSNTDPRVGGALFGNGLLEGNAFGPFSLGNLSNAMLSNAIDPRGRPGLLGPGPVPNGLPLGQVSQALNPSAFLLQQAIGAASGSFIPRDRNDMMRGPGFPQGQGWMGGRPPFNDPRLN